VRYPQFVSPNASSVEVVVNTAPHVFDVSVTSPLCTTTAGARTCVLTVGAPIGSDTFAITVFSGANASGSVLSTATTSTMVVAGTPFAVSVALNAVLGMLVVALQNAAFGGSCPNAPAGTTGIVEGCSGSATIAVSAFDPSGAQITGTQPYPATIQLATSDTALAIAPAQITAPGQTATLTYAGAAFGASVTNTAMVNASAGGQGAGLSFPVMRQYLYVVNANAPEGVAPPGGGNVEVFAFGASGNATPVRVLAGPLTQLSTPVDSFVDGAGELYVLEEGPYSGVNSQPVVLVFAPGATGNVAPIRAISGVGAVTMNLPCETMTRDSVGGHLSVICDDNGAHVFPVSGNGSAASLQLYSLQDASWSYPIGQFFDAAGNLYVNDGSTNAIFEYAPPLPASGTNAAISATKTISSSVWPAGIDPLDLRMDRQGNAVAVIAYVNTSSGPQDAGNEVAIWRKGTLPCNNCSPSATLTGAPFSTHLPNGTAEDAAGNLYVSNSVTNQVFVFAGSMVSSAVGATSNPPLLRTINTGANPSSPGGMAIGP